jgi:hypothetical protein
VDVRSCAAIAVGAALLSWVAIWNGYPLLFSDSLRYLNGGILRYVPSEAPIFYGAFMIPFHLNGFSLWPVVAAQCLLVSYSVAAVLRALGLFEPGRFALIMAGLAGMSSAPWFTAFIMPDVFTAIVVLTMFALYRGWPKFHPLERAFLAALALLAISTHVSHLVLGLGLALLLIAFGALRRRISWTLCGTLLALPVTAIVAVVVCNTISKGRPVLSRNGPVFLLARAYADGPAYDYMREHCGERQWRLCAALPALPRDSELFLWAERSVWDLGIPAEEVRSEAGQIVSGTIHEHPGWLLALAVENTLQQLLTFRAGVDFRQWPDSDAVLTVTGVVRRFFPHEFARYMNSRQQTGRLETFGPNLIYSGVVLFSFACLILMLIRLQDPDIGEFAAVVAAALLLNAAATAPFSVVADRYQARIVWLLPLAFAISLLALQRRRGAPPVLAAGRSLKESP